MSMTRESRRERLERLGTLPDAQIRILWGRVIGYALLWVSLIGSTVVLVELMYRAAGL